MTWRSISLIHAALAGAVFFWQLYAGGGVARVLPAGAMALVFGLEFVGLPLLGRTARALRERRKR
jgi:hypothetical protein